MTARAQTVPRWRSEVVVDDLSEHAEGPLWDAEEGVLRWVDQYRGRIRAARITEAAPDRDGPGSAETLADIEVDAPVGAIVPRAEGGWIVAAGDGIRELGRDGARAPLAGAAGHALTQDGVQRRMNDGKVDPRGRFWFGSMALDKRPGGGSLYLLDRGELREMLPATTISNGLAWSPDGGTLFYIDTPTGIVRRFRVDERVGLVDEGVAVRIAAGTGSPDGMCVDAEGCLWVALWGGSSVRRFSPDGELLGIVDVDAPQVSSCAFGGADLGTLFITTSAEDYGAEERARHPRAGAIFGVRTGVRGRLPDAYRS